MPPKFKYTKEEIISAAVDIVRAEGEEGLTARSLAKALGTSVKPIFIQFSGMDEVREQVISTAYALYQSYLQADMTQGKYPPYKASGMAYIRFAGEEKQLFKLLFMRDRTNEVYGESREELRPILDIICKNLNVDEDTAYLFHLENWVYVHGIATMIATSYIAWDLDFTEKSLTDIYLGLKHRHTGD